MKPLKKRLLALKGDIRIAIVGAGDTGHGLFNQACITPGMKAVAIADIRIEKAISCAQRLNRDYEIVRSVDALHRAIERGRLAITDHGELLCSSELINVMIEATNALQQGAIHAMKAIQHHQHVIMMNTKADLMYGPHLLQLANEEGVVYTSCDGSRQAVIKKLVDDMDLWGLDLVMAGCMEMPIDRYIHPGRVISGPDRSPNYGYISGMDGTMLNMELSVLANGINARTATPGMQGSQIAKIQDILFQYDFDAAWSNKLPIVDYIEGGEPEGCVFAVGYTENKMQQEQLAHLQQLGSGPYYVFHRPQCLGFIEAMECVMEAYFNGTARLQPQYGMKTNVFAYAKKYLEKGEVLDGPGGYKCYGLIENLEEKHFPGLPICLADGLKLKSDIPPDQRITLEDVDYDPDDIEFSLYFRSLQANPQKPIPPRKRVTEENLQYIIPVTW